MNFQGPLIGIAEDYYFPRNPDITSDETKRQYKFAFNDFDESLGRAASLADLDDDRLVMMQTWMQRQKRDGRPRFSAKTINERTGRIRAFWGFMFKRGHVPTFPTFAKLREPKRVPVAWKRNELDTLIVACGSARGFVGPVFACNWWLSLHLCMWDCAGERITALVSSRWEWMSLDEQGRTWLTIPAENRKNQKEDMAYRLSAESVAALELIRAPRRALIWPWPFSKPELWRKYKKLRKSAGLPTDRKSSFHRMRKSVASHFEAAGGNATKLLRHSSRQVTEESYLDVTITGDVQASDLLFRLKPPDNAG